jgi:ubiquitin-protein ligase
MKRRAVINKHLIDDLVWHGVYFVKQGLFAGGVFKFIIEFPALYPNQKPQVRFLSPLLHPLVDPNTHAINLDVIYYF